MEQNKPARMCNWKPAVTAQTPNGERKQVRFPCRYPDEELTSELCTQCLLGEMFAVLYSQHMALKKSGEMTSEVMTFLRSMTDDGSLDDLR